MIEARRGGHLVNVSSAAGIIGMPWHAAYSASKFGLRGVSEVLRFDLRRHRIGVSLVCPGGVRTPLTQTVRIAGIDKREPAFRKAQAGFHKRAVTPEKAARRSSRVSPQQVLGLHLQRHPHGHLLQRYFPPGYARAMRGMNYGANKVLPAVRGARTRR